MQSVGERCLAYLPVLWLWLLFGGRALAQEREDAVLLLSISEQGAHSGRLSALLESYLERRGPARSSRELSAAQRTDRDLDRLNALASDKRASLLLWGNIESLPEKRKRIELRVYNARRGSTVPDSEVCGADAVEETLKVVADRLLSSLEPQPVAAPEQKPETPLRLVERTIHRPPKPRWRKRLGIGLIAAGGVALGSAIVLTAMHGQAFGTGCPLTRFDHTPPTASRCLYNTIPAFSAAYALAAGLGVSAYLTLELP